MISLSNIDVLEAIRAFSSNERAATLDVSFLVPTITSLEKSIMDATGSMKNYLQSSNIHNFGSQEKGEENKKILPIKYIHGDEVIESKISFYRPLTKQGDPRLWIYGLKKYAKSGDLLALVTSEEQLTVVNCSQTSLQKVFSNKSSMLSYISSNQMSNNAQELLDKLKDISKLGFIKSLKKGDTGIGYTLETLLGIKANSSPLTDY